MRTRAGKGGLCVGEKRNMCDGMCVNMYLILESKLQGCSYETNFHCLSFALKDSLIAEEINIAQFCEIT